MEYPWSSCSFYIMKFHSQKNAGLASCRCAQGSYSDTIGLLRAEHSRNPTRHSQNAGLASCCIAHDGASPKIFRPHLSKLMCTQIWYSGIT